MTRLLATCVLALCGTLAAAQAPGAAPGPNGVFLIAKPELTDPNFTRTVVLVTQTEDFSTVGVIINRPTTLRLSDFPTLGEIETGKYTDRIYLGGPVMRNALLAVFQSDEKPSAPAFHVLRKLYITMHPDNMKGLLESTDRRYRLYAGFSGWAPRQLESEFNRAGWYVLPADEAMVFRENTEGLWEELLHRAQGLKTRFQSEDRERMRDALDCDIQFF
ncbi:MAG: YqgE/AlgH family protein [Betaproteobacteria bacterium]|nr:YqgE/AlgH family protein [Betaproteobacteria bacterium]